MSHSGFDKHNHAACVHDAMGAAESYCADKKLQFTPVRRRALEILLGEHKAMGAYDMLARLSDEGMGSAPPVAYRALDFLVSNGFVHKIEKLNAYIACAHPGQRHDPAFMICKNCNKVAEACTHPGKGQLGNAARDLGFHIETATIEAEGTCPACHDAQGAKA